MSQRIKLSRNIIRILRQRPYPDLEKDIAAAKQGKAVVITTPFRDNAGDRRAVVGIGQNRGLFLRPGEWADRNL